MDAIDRGRLVKALDYVLEHHGSQTRKGKEAVPYVSHLLQVCGLALEYGEGDLTLAEAALLHDIVEDTERSVDDVRRHFGDEVAAIVASCTDLLDGDTPDQKGPWRERKERYIAHLRQAPKRTRIVSACDKLHNLTNIVADLRAEGPGFLELFNGKTEGTVWYYRELRDALGADLPPPLRKSFAALVVDLEALSSPGPDQPGRSAT